MNCIRNHSYDPLLQNLAIRSAISAMSGAVSARKFGGVAEARRAGNVKDPHAVLARIARGWARATFVLTMPSFLTRLVEIDATGIALTSSNCASRTVGVDRVTPAAFQGGRRNWGDSCVRGALHPSKQSSRRKSAESVSSCLVRTALASLYA